MLQNIAVLRPRQGMIDRQAGRQTDETESRTRLKNIDQQPIYNWKWRFAREILKIKLYAVNIR